MLNRALSDFSVPGTGEVPFRLSEIKAALVVIYFYPKDNTPGCTTEGANFRDLYPEFHKADCEIVGISRDSIRSHQNFKAKLALPFELLSDEDETACNLFDVIKMKNMYGKKVRGIERSTFVLDEDRIVRREWRAVKVPGHVQEVLDFVRAV